MDKSLGLSVVVPYIIYKGVHTQKRSLLCATFLLLIVIPFWEKISSLHPLLYRFHWPEKELVIFWYFCLLPLVASLKKSQYLIPIIIIESVITSFNYPLQWTPIEHELCLQQIQTSSKQMYWHCHWYINKTICGACTNEFMDVQ